MGVLFLKMYKYFIGFRTGCSLETPREFAPQKFSNNIQRKRVSDEL